MNREDIIRMADQCGIPEFINNESQADNILRFAALIAAAEREACAKVCDDELKEWGIFDSDVGDVSKAIRARGNQ